MVEPGSKPKVLISNYRGHSAVNRGYSDHSTASFPKTVALWVGLPLTFGETPELLQKKKKPS